MRRCRRPAWRLLAAGTAALLLGVTAIAADNPPNLEEEQEQELSLIPAAASASPQDQAGRTAAGSGRVYLEGAFTVSSERGGLLVPVPPPPSSDWQGRVLLDVRKQWSLADTLRFVLSDRFNARFESDIHAPNHENLINELREAYLSFEPWTQTYLDVGRINLKSGVALGYNPTDYFKTRAVVNALSADPAVLREDRLGALMISMQRVGQAGSVTLALAPALHAPSPFSSNLDLSSADLLLGRTNAASRILLKASLNVRQGLSPELLVLREGNATRFGVNLTQNVNQRTVAYLEWSGGRTMSLVDQAWRFALDSGTVPPAVRSPLDDGGHSTFRHELAVGASYTPGSSATFNVEYHLNTSAMSGADWNRWFSLGSGRNPADPVVAALWLMREYALEQQQPLTRQSIFLRANWVDAFVRKLNLSGFADVDLRDGSAALQLDAEYYVGDLWTVGGLVRGYLGTRRSDYGSLPQDGSALLSVVRYF